MKILEVRSLAVPEIKVIRFARFRDHRGYFTELFRKSDYHGHPQLRFMKNVEFCQCNESHSKPGTVRGFHFQWNPHMGKMVRTVAGHMVDLILDIRKGSPSLGRILAYDMPGRPEIEFCEWIWVPPGFAHGNFFLETTIIEYFCSGEYSPDCEAGISPLATDLDWSLCEPALKNRFDATVSGTALISEKDRTGYSLQSWLAHPDAEQFLYEKLRQG